MQRKSRNFKNFSNGFPGFEFEGGNKVNKHGGQNVHPGDLWNSRPQFRPEISVRWKLFVFSALGDFPLFFLDVKNMCLWKRNHLCMCSIQNRCILLRRSQKRAIFAHFLKRVYLWKMGKKWILFNKYWE